MKSRNIRISAIVTGIALVILLLFLSWAAPAEEWPPKTAKGFQEFLMIFLLVAAGAFGFTLFLLSLAYKDKITNEERGTKLKKLDNTYNQTIEATNDTISVVTKNNMKSLFVPLALVSAGISYFLRYCLSKYMEVSLPLLLIIFIFILSLFLVFYVLKYKAIYVVDVNNFTVKKEYWFLTFTNKYILSQMSNIQKLIIDHSTNGVYSHSDRAFKFDYNQKTKEIKMELKEDAYNLLLDKLFTNSKK